MYQTKKTVKALETSISIPFYLFNPNSIKLAQVKNNCSEASISFFCMSAYCCCHTLCNFSLIVSQMKATSVM